MTLSAEQEKEPVKRGFCYMRHQTESQHTDDVEGGIKLRLDELCKQKRFVTKTLIGIILVAVVQVGAMVYGGGQLVQKVDDMREMMFENQDERIGALETKVEGLQVLKHRVLVLENE